MLECICLDLGERPAREIVRHHQSVAYLHAARKLSGAFGCDLSSKTLETIALPSDSFYD